ncbi:SDR family oxidoreductase [Candidatus Microgenomates bacterium]|nr:MAG: SDR family oxidoreductase [Candidatus Microgenomates bacterium]
MKCLVTGGAGFIGSHLCDSLLAAGHSVVALDSLITGSRENVSHLAGNPHFQFMEHNVVEDLPDSIGPIQAIFHFASPASPPKYQAYPLDTLLANTVGTHKLLMKAKDWGAIFLYASTSEVYGNPLEHPQKETYWGNVNPNGPRSCYDEAKRCGEAWVATYVRNYNLDARIVRIFNTYGPRMDIDDGRVITNFIKQILRQEPLTIYGSGDQTRSFCFVTDLVEGIMALFSHPKMKGEVVNLGTSEEKTVKQIASMLSKIARYKGELVYKPLPEDDPVRRKPDLTKAKKMLGFKPQVALTQGLTKTLSYFKKRT